MSFTEEWLSSGHSTIKAWLLECCRDGCPSGRFSHLHRGTLELCQSDHRVIGHLPDQALGRVLFIPNFFHLIMMEDTVFFGIFNAAFFWYPSPDLWLDTILSRSSTDNSFELMAHSDMHCGTLDRCVPFLIMSNQFNLPQVNSNQVVETSQGWSMETGCTWAQFQVS